MGKPQLAAAAPLARRQWRALRRWVYPLGRIVQWRTDFAPLVRQ